MLREFSSMHRPSSYWNMGNTMMTSCLIPYLPPVSQGANEIVSGLHRWRLSPKDDL